MLEISLDPTLIDTPYIDRFAPSPTGELHLGHAFSALTSWRAAVAEGGRFLLRIEDLDQGRSHPEFVDAIYRDLAWIGIDWERPVMFQSTRLPAYQAALDHLTGLGLTYRCTCTRRDIAEVVVAPQEGAPPSGPDGLVYPGTCRGADHPPGVPAAIRLDIRRAIAALGGVAAVAALYFREISAHPTGDIHIKSEVLINGTGDIVLARRDGAPAYHLAVVVDDAYQGVSHITRGHDLFTSTPIHRLLQALLGLPTPTYRHHRLIRDTAGKRLAKRDRDHSLAQLKARGWRPEDVLTCLGLGA